MLKITRKITLFLNIIFVQGSTSLYSSFKLMKRKIFSIAIIICQFQIAGGTGILSLAPAGITEVESYFQKSPLENIWSNVLESNNFELTQAVSQILKIIDPNRNKKQGAAQQLIPYFLSRVLLDNNSLELNNEIIEKLSVYKLRLIADQIFRDQEIVHYKKLWEVAPASIASGTYPFEYSGYKRERQRIKEQFEKLVNYKLVQNDRNMLFYIVGPSTGEEVLSLVGLLYETLKTKKITDWDLWDIHFIGLDPKDYHLDWAQHMLYSTRNSDNSISSNMTRTLESTGAFEKSSIDDVPVDLRSYGKILTFQYGHIFKLIPALRKWIGYIHFNLYDHRLVNTIARFGKADMVFSRYNFRWNIRSQPDEQSIVPVFGPPSQEDNDAFMALGQLAKDDGLIVIEPVENSKYGYKHPQFESVGQPNHGIYRKRSKLQIKPPSHIKALNESL